MALVTQEPRLSLSAEIFRAYDIRGIVDEAFTAEAVFAIGRAFGQWAMDLGLKQVVVGRDGRLSGPRLISIVRQALMAAGVEVIDVGLVPTPVLYYAAQAYGTGTGIMLTGSHNPPEYNGMKLMLAGKTLAAEGLQALKERTWAGRTLVPAAGGSLVHRDIKPDYQQRLLQEIQLKRPLKVVVDAGSGAAAMVVPAVLEALGCTVIPLFCEVDGHFPHHHPDPSQPQNLEALIACVRLEKADIGLAFDGDGDRLGVVTETGQIIWPDRQMMLFAQDVLSRHPGAKIVYDVKCSRHLATVIRAAGGVPVMTKTGHSLIKAKMQETGALLGGEMSGHIFFKERWYGFDDACYAAARLLECIAAQEKTVSQVFAALPDALSTPELQIPLADDQKFAFMEALIAQASFPGAESITLDGLRLEFAQGWGLVRVSNTTPNLVCRFEAETAEALAAIQAVLKAEMLKIAPGMLCPF